jgi:thioesterase domain-containing protein
MQMIEHELIDTHLVPLRSLGARPLLFCLPGVGDANAYDFRELVDALPKDQPVYGFRWPAMDGTTDLFSVEELAELYLADIRRIQKAGPFYLCGQSLGGLIAYEIATLLVSSGERIGLLALFDADNPALTASLSQRDHFRFRQKYVLDRFRKYYENIRCGDFREVVSDALRFLRGRLTTAVGIAVRAAFRLAKRPVPKMMRSRVLTFTAAWYAYNPKKYPRTLVLFRAKDRRAEYEDDPTLGWKKCVTGPIEVHIAPGDHVTMMQSPHVHVLAEALSRYLGTAIDHAASRV